MTVEYIRYMAEQEENLFTQLEVKIFLDEIDRLQNIINITRKDPLQMYAESIERGED